MSPKEKVNATSSESTSSSNSSSSSSSSSSTSGSESSSSDSENSSSSQASAAKSHGSTDSDNRKPAPKKKATPVKGKSAASNEAESSKPKEKSHTKGRNSKSAANYSSEEEVPIKPPPKRKPPAKPKATATVTPITKPARQPTARAKAAAAARANANREKNSKAAASKQTESAAQKKLKTKSIFSPENSSESDDQGTQPPKLSPMKSTAKVVSHPKPKPKATSKAEPVPVRASKSNSSASSTSGSSVSSDSSSDSESSADSAATAKPAKKKACTIKKISASTATPARQRGETQARSKTQASTTETSAAAAGASESEGEPLKPVVTRKLTRSSSARRSKHLIGKTSDTESETEAKAKSAPAKKAAGPKGPAQRPKTKTRSSGALDTLQKPLEEERRCPLEGCDSLGHLSGKMDKHFTIDACPMYHNKTAQECKEAAAERKKHEDDRRKAVASMNKKSPKGNLSADQRHFQMKVKEMRTKNKTQPVDPDDSAVSEGKEREPRLTNLVPEYDLRLFQEAQAMASEKIEEDLKTLPHVKGTKYVEMGKFEMEVWYQSPYPEEYARVPKLYICEYCLRYMKSRTILKRHMVKCVWRHPPGEEVYRKEKISVWEVDGKRYKQYCQNLCLLAKFFLDHKTLYYDVEPFLFYVMTIGDSEGCHTVGYFSKEKNSFLNYNVSCILTLPPYQRQGYGRLLIDFSYLLTRVERKIGSPEKPLSDLGLISYRSYWKDVLLEYLCKFGGKELSIKDLSQEMAINSYDIVSTLQALGMMKYWKGKHIILKKQDVIEEYEERMKRRGASYKEIDPAFLKWTPFAAAPAGVAGPP